MTRKKSLHHIKLNYILSILVYSNKKKYEIKSRNSFLHDFFVFLHVMYVNRDFSILHSHYIIVLHYQTTIAEKCYHVSVEEYYEKSYHELPYMTTDF